MTSTPDPQAAFRRVAEAIHRVFQGLHNLQERAELLQPPPLEGQEWYELLRQKLVPQLGGGGWLVAAVVGGTNIGKSVVFNHLAGCKASSSSPLASGTRHPVCLVPQGFSEGHDLQTIFPDFQLHEWSDASLALNTSDNHDLYWRAAPELPSTLLVLDTPDIDSDARVNWVRADAVRRSADILIAVLTQQKYNDAAVKEFFRKAAAEDKAVLIVFNQCLLPEDEAYWPVWVKTFCEETGVRPEAVYVAPNDRAAADQLALPFYERPWPVPENWGATEVSNVTRDLKADLSQLKFKEIRLRTLRGSLKEVLDPRSGLPAYLKSLQIASKDLAATSEKLSSEAVLKIRDWPTPHNSTFVEEIRDWWKSRQQGWAKKVNSFYDTLGAGVTWPFRKARDVIQGEPVPALDKYRELEWTAILTTIEELFDKLQWMADTGNRMVKPRIEEILQASTRTRLMETVRQKHAAINFEDEVKDVVASEMATFSEDSPELFRIYKQLHNVSAAVRPMTSVVLFSLGMGPAGETFAPVIADAAANAVVHVVTDVAGGTAAAVAGDTALSGAAASTSGMLQTWFHRLHSVFTQRRVDWLTGLIREELMGDLPEKIKQAADLPASEQFVAVSSSVTDLQSFVNQLQLPDVGEVAPQELS
ncbi:MAG: 50S ribosome-binding GTPase [Planctomycetaceae bacterium]|nr:50S ribosome-binding GTPase [Planctomycetaceae bacterium]